MLLGAAAQVGIFLTYIGALGLGFSSKEAASIGIIGGADGPTSIFLSSILAPHLLGPIAIAAYSYCGISTTHFIQPPIMKLMTTDAERRIRMKPPRKVCKMENILFPIIVTIILSFCVGASTQAIRYVNGMNVGFLTSRLLEIFFLGFFSFVVAIFGGVLFAKIMDPFLKEKINPLIGFSGCVCRSGFCARLTNRRASVRQG